MNKRYVSTKPSKVDEKLIGKEFITFTGAKIKVLSYSHNIGDSIHYLVEFLDTGYRKTTQGSKIRDGMYLKDDSIGNVVDNRMIGNIFHSEKYGDILVLELDHVTKFRRYYKCRFLNTGYETVAYGPDIERDAVRDLFYPSVCGIGYTGMLNASSEHLHEYTIWNHMLDRCYNPNSCNYPKYGAKGVYVCERWHCFANFLNDLPYLDGYDYEKLMNGELHFDKDLKQPNVDIKVYSPETCMFLPVVINSGLPRGIIPCNVNLNGKDIYADSIQEMSEILNINPNMILYNPNQSNFQSNYLNIMIIPATINKPY